jgi:hypothetical protein
MTYRFHDSQHHEAKPEVNDEAKIKMRRDVPGRLWKVRHKQKIDSVPRHDGDQ